MQLFYADESNMNPAEAEFFVYAGVVIPENRAADLSARVDGIRRNYRYGPKDLLKFNTRERPAHVTPAQHADIKREVMAAACACEAKLVASFILHNVATSPEEARRKEINRISYHFHRLLNRADEHGLVLLEGMSRALLRIEQRRRLKIV